MFSRPAKIKFPIRRDRLGMGLIAVSLLFSFSVCLAQDGGGKKRGPNRTAPVVTSTTGNPTVDRLKSLKDLYDQGLITREAYDQGVKKVLDSAVTSGPPTQPGLILHYDFARPADDGRVTDLSGNPIPGGAVAAGPYSAVTGLDGTYSLAVPAGTWDAICTAGGYVSQTAQGVVVGPGEDVERNFALGSVANSDEYAPSMELRVLFLGPNPFRERLLISYAADPKQPASMELFDLRGRLVEKRWLNPARSGNGEFVWDGRDARGRTCPSRKGELGILSWSPSSFVAGLQAGARWTPGWRTLASSEHSEHGLQQER